MPEVPVQLSEQLYALVQRRAVEAGFANLGEYIVDVVSKDIADEENLDHRFTPAVMAHLNRIQHDIETGAKTYTDEEVDEYLQERAQAWRQSHARQTPQPS